MHMRRVRENRLRWAALGLSMVELMIGTLVGLFVVLGTVNL